MHHALGLAGRAGGEGEIDHLVGIGLRPATSALAGPMPGQQRRVASRSSGFSRIDVLDRLGRLQRVDEVALVGVGAVALLPDEGDGARALHQLDHLADRVVAVQRRAADRAALGAGEQRHHALDPALQPDADPLARPHAMRGEIGRERVGGFQQLPIGEAAEPVAHRKRIRLVAGVPAHQRIDRVAAPEALGFVFAGSARRTAASGWCSSGCVVMPASCGRTIPRGARVNASGARGPASGHASDANGCSFCSA